MEYLDGYEVLRKQLIRGIVNIDVATTVVKNCACVHDATHVARIGQSGIEDLQKQFT